MPARQRLSRRCVLERRRHAPAPRRLSLGEAMMLGAFQGPTELLPISSSGHTALIPWLAGWSYAGLEPQLRKSFEVALHAGAGAALAIDMRGELVEAARKLDQRRVAVIALSLAPPVIAGFVLERPIERRLGGPRSIACGLILGGVAMALADLRPGRREHATGGGDTCARDGRVAGSALGEVRARGARSQEEAGPGDGLVLGLAQAAALIPGVSRSGATLTAARARGFARTDAQALSWHVALPVILGASALKAWRLRRNGVDELGGTLAVGASSAFVSTLISAGLLRRTRLRGRPLLPYSVYRCALALATLKRLRGAHNRSR